MTSRQRDGRGHGAKPQAAQTPALDLSVPSTPANSYITDICRWFVWGREEWLPTSVWVSLLGCLGISSPGARTALHRMSKGGYLQRSSRGGRPGYEMSSAWMRYFERDSDRPASSVDGDGWTIVIFTIPEERRADRHVLRTILSHAGFTALGNGVWIASAARLLHIRIALEEAGLAGDVEIFVSHYAGFATAAEFASQRWDLEGLAARYETFVEETRQRLRHSPRVNARSFEDLVLTSNAWRRIDFADPHLPVEALPSRWPREVAGKLYERMVSTRLDAARAWVESLAHEA